MAKKRKDDGHIHVTTRRRTDAEFEEAESRMDAGDPVRYLDDDQVGAMSIINYAKVHTF